MKKIILALVFASGVALAAGNTLDYTGSQVNVVVGDDIAQFGAGGHLATSCTNALVQDTWTDFTNCTFTIPFVSGFAFVTNSVVVYTNGSRWFHYSGNVGIESTVTQNHAVEFGISTNGVYVEGSTSGPRELSADGQKGSVAFNCPVYLEENDTIGLVIKLTDRTSENLIINTWQSNLSRY